MLPIVQYLLTRFILVVIGLGHHSSQDECPDSCQEEQGRTEEDQFLILDQSPDEDRGRDDVLGEVSAQAEHH